MTPIVYDELTNAMYETQQDRNAKKMKEALERLKKKHPGVEKFETESIFIEMMNG